MLSPTADEESERKRLFAVLLEGAPVVVLDNIEGSSPRRRCAAS